MAKLSTSQRLRKRDHHRCANDERNREQITRIDAASRRRRWKIYYRDGVFRHVTGEKPPVVALVNHHRIDFFQVRSADVTALVLDKDLVDTGLLFQWKLQRK